MTSAISNIQTVGIHSLLVVAGKTILILDPIGLHEECTKSHLFSSLAVMAGLIEILLCCECAYAFAMSISSDAVFFFFFLQIILGRIALKAIFMLMTCQPSSQLLDKGESNSYPRNHLENLSFSFLAIEKPV